MFHVCAKAFDFFNQRLIFVGQLAYPVNAGLTLQFAPVKVYKTLFAEYQPGCDR